MQLNDFVQCYRKHSNSIGIVTSYKPAMLTVWICKGTSVVVAVIRGHTRMLSANFGRSQGIRRMLSAFTNNYN